MIYLIESFMRSGDDHPLRCLKIGYAKNVEERMKAYKTYNPSVKLLKTREGDYDLENYLHNYFKRYELSDFNEWFIYSKKIIEEFDSIKITDDEYIYIRSEIINKIIPREYEKTFSKIPILLCELEKDFNRGMFMDNIYSEFPKDLCKKTIKDVLNFLKNQEIDYYKTVDFSQDLKEPGLIENPWKNRAEMYFKYLSNKNQKSQEEFMEIIQRKMSRTKNLLEVYDSTENSFVKFDLAAKWSDAMNNYLNDYISINRHSGSSIIPVFNNLVMVSELRAFEIQQVDYKDRFSVFNSIITETNSQLMSDIVNEVLNSFDNFSMFTEKMKYLCDVSQKLSSFDLDLVFSQVPLIYKNYFNSLGAEKIRSLGYQKSRLESEYMKVKVTNAEINFLIEVRSLYKVGERIPLGEIKSKLQQLYDAYGLISTAKAKDIEKYYNVQIIRFPKDPITGKRDQGYEILSLK